MSLDVLIVDDELDIRDLMSDILVDDGYKPRTACNSTEALIEMQQRIPSAIILDIWLQDSELDGLGILEVVKKQYPDIPVIMISGHGNIETAISSIKMGAYDYIEKPFKEERILSILRRAVESARLKEENSILKSQNTFDTKIIGNSNAVISLKTAIEKVSNAESRVMIQGPAGCGKEVVAKIIHSNSQRRGAPFIKLNAAGIDSENVEEALFGKESCTEKNGIKAIKSGTFEKAHGGTLFIDEVSDIPIDVQAKIIKFLQNKCFKRVGGSTDVHVDVRIISSTSKNLNEQIARGKMREDLYYRLNVVPITIPSLKDRRGDLADIAKHMIEKCAKSLGVAQRYIAPSALASMELYSWPGNIRQLKNVIEWLLIMAPGNSNDAIISSMLPPEILSKTPIPSLSSDENYDIMGLTLREAREIFEKRYISAQLERFSGNVSKTASFVGMERSAFHRKLKILSINEQDNN